MKLVESKAVINFTVQAVNAEKMAEYMKEMLRIGMEIGGFEITEHGDTWIVRKAKEGLDA